MSLDETKQDLLADLGLEATASMALLENLSAAESRYLRDLRVNVKNVIESEQIPLKEAWLLALAVAANEKNDPLIDGFSRQAASAGASPEEVAEALACASLLATNNVFYRFKHFMAEHNPNYQALPARIKMNLMARPALGKELFELMSLVVSAVNGCQMCVASHEASVRGLGVSEAKVFDAVRLGAVIRGLALVVR